MKGCFEVDVIIATLQLGTKGHSQEEATLRHIFDDEIIKVRLTYGHEVKL